MDTLAIGFLGWLGGMLVNYLSDMLPNLRRLKMPVCIHCFENQSLTNYLFWPRSCQHCRQRRPLRVWVVELVYIVISVWLWRYPHDGMGYWLSFVLVVFFGVVVVVDLEHRLILHPVSIVGAVLCLGIGWKLHGLWMTLLGGAAGFASMYVLHILGDLFARWLARRRGEVLTEVALGFGDVNLSGVLGLLLGWPGIGAGLVLAVLFGGLVSLVYLLWMLVAGRYHSFAAIPYGPFLVASGLLLIFL
jgi:leader peptidase (prepilin peptidase)/N-methyltransferase